MKNGRRCGTNNDHVRDRRCANKTDQSDDQCSKTVPHNKDIFSNDKSQLDFGFCGTWLKG